MLTDATRVSDYPDAMVVLSCQGCSREIRYLKSLIVDIFGADTTLAQLREKFTVDCPRRSDPKAGACAIEFAPLQIVRR